MEERLAEARAGRNEGDVTGRGPCGCLEDQQFRRSEHRHGVRHGLQIVEDGHRASAKRAGQARGVGAPWHVDHPGGQAVNDAGDAEADRVHRAHARLTRERLNQRFDAVEVQRDVLTDDFGGRADAVPAKASKQRFCRADVASQDHRPE